MKRKLPAVLLLLALAGLPPWAGNKPSPNTSGAINLDKPYLAFGSQGAGTASSGQTAFVVLLTGYGT